MNYLFTSESVSPGHPDKMCDQISDAVLDAVIESDSKARTACETLAKTGMILLAGELTTTAWVDIETLVRDLVCKIGYDNSSYGFDGNTCAIINVIGKQSPDIAQGVEKQGKRHQGAGDQGIMFGYAIDETETLMPAPITYAHLLVRRHHELFKSRKISWLRPDAKSQVTFIYDNNNRVQGIDSIVLSTQHDEGIELKTIEEAVIETIIKPTLPSKWLKNTTYHINPTGKFVIGGPVSDCGLTGRKIIVDTYGGSARHGGGAFSGKDPSKVDRSAAYAARYIAKNIVAAKLAKRCEVQLSYAIGVIQPKSVYVNTFGTGVIDDAEITKRVIANFDLTPYGINQMLDLNRPIYLQTATYGHFGREDIDLSWEKTDRVDALK